MLALREKRKVKQSVWANELVGLSCVHIGLCSHRPAIQDVFISDASLELYSLQAN